MLDIHTLAALVPPTSTSRRAPLPGLPRRKVIRIATGCTDPEQFVATFWRMCQADACFVPTTTMRPAGLEAVFALQLADGRPLLRGVAVVRAAWPNTDNPFGRPGMFLGFRRLTADSRALVVRMVAQRAATRRAHSDTIPQPREEAADSATPTIAMAPLRGDGVVEASEASEASDLTERCEPAFADCVLDEPPRAAIATILGIAPLPKVHTKPEPSPPPIAVPVASPPRAGHAQVWMFACLAFAIAFVVAVVSSR